MKHIPVHRAVIHQQVTAHFGYFDKWFDEAAFGNTNLKREPRTSPIAAGTAA